MERLTIHNINQNYPLWKRIIELDYNLLGLADNIFITPVKYYFSPKGFGIILSRDMLIVSGNDRKKVRDEITRLENKLNKNIRKS